MERSSILRQLSGIDVNPLTHSKYMIIRSISIGETGELKDELAFREIFEGIFSVNGWAIEYFALPSTIVMKDGASVAMASQIYERTYSEVDTKQLYSEVETYEQYFLKRKELSYDVGKKPVITWLGAPSIIFTYENRDKLKRHLHGNPAINLFFWLTSFNSTTCIGNFSRSEEYQQIPYCDKYKELKRFCNQKDKYQIHKTYNNAVNGISSPVKFITNFDDAIDSVINEDAALDKYNESSPIHYYQRYNELFTYFFPWDIDGVERGGVPNNIFTKLLLDLNTKRRKIIEDLTNIRDERGTIISKINLVIERVLTKNPKNIKDLLEDPANGLNYTYFLLAKFILLAECDLLQHNETYSIENSDTEQTRIVSLVDDIVEIMLQKLNVYEYELLETEKFQMIKKNEYDDGVELGERESKFVLFEQIKDENALTGVFKADKQLNISRTEGGGKNRRKKQKRQTKKRKSKKVAKMRKCKSKKNI